MDNLEVEVEVEEEEDDNGNSKEEGLGVAFCLTMGASATGFTTGFTYFSICLARILPILLH